MDEDIKRPHPGWPGPGQHLFGQWMVYIGPPKRQEYRMCVHPDCKYWEVRDIPNI